jgi:hypothetical protein
MNQGYVYVAEELAVDFLVSLANEEQDLLRSYFRWLATRPHIAGTLEHRDGAGRAVQAHLCGPFLIATWSDHAVREVRIVEVFRD